MQLDQLVLAAISFATTNALPALFVVVLLEEAGIPIPVPSDMLILLAGVAGVDRGLGFMLAVVAVAVAGALIGSSILYVFMRHGGRRFVARHGRLVFLGPKRVARMERWFREHHRHALLLGRLIPGLRIPATALAGISGLPYRRYLPAATVAAFIWAATFLGLGVAAHAEGPFLLQVLLGTIKTVTLPMFVLIVVLVVLDALLSWLLLARRRLKAAEDAGLVPLPPDGTGASTPTPAAADSSRDPGSEVNRRDGSSSARSRELDSVS